MYLFVVAFYIRKISVRNNQTYHRDMTFFFDPVSYLAYSDPGIFLGQGYRVQNNGIKTIIIYKVKNI